MALRSRARPGPGDFIRDNARTLHEQLTGVLRTNFLSAYAPGDRVPAESQISARYGLSRVTVRRAFQTLAEEGLLIPRQGKGTFLATARPRITYEIDRLAPFLDAFSETGESVNVRLLSFGWVADHQVPSCFGEDSALVYERLYETAGSPHALLRIAIPARLGERISRSDTTTIGVYRILEEKLGIAPTNAEFTISTALPDASLASSLKVPSTTPLLLVERRSYDALDQIIECTTHHLLPDVYKLSVRVKSSDPDKL